MLLSKEVEPLQTSETKKRFRRISFPPVWLTLPVFRLFFSIFAPGYEKSEALIVSLGAAAGQVAQNGWRYAPSA
jgi:hypothetical protein